MPPDVQERIRDRTVEHGGAILELVAMTLRSGRFEARLGDRTVCVSSKPFLDAARVLLAEGGDPGTVLQMRHQGSATIALRSTVGAAAKLTIDEAGPRFAVWRPFTAALPVALASP